MDRNSQFQPLISLLGEMQTTWQKFDSAVADLNAATQKAQDAQNALNAAKAKVQFGIFQTTDTAAWQAFVDAQTALNNANAAIPALRTRVDQLQVTKGTQFNQAEALLGAVLQN